MPTEQLKAKAEKNNINNNNNQFLPVQRSQQEGHVSNLQCDVLWESSCPPLTTAHIGYKYETCFTDCCKHGPVKWNGRIAPCYTFLLLIIIKNCWDVELLFCSSPSSIQPVRTRLLCYNGDVAKKDQDHVQKCW